MSGSYTVLVQPSAFGVGSRVRCEQCGEERELAFMEDQLEAIAAIANAHALNNAALFVRAMTEHRANVDRVAGECIELAVFLLTHTTGHDEQRRRDATRAPAGDVS